MRKASLGTLFLTVFLDLLGFGLVIPFLPGVARQLGASDLVAALLATAFSLMSVTLRPDTKARVKALFTRYRLNSVCSA